jgi:hypothetical protein
MRKRFSLRDLLWLTALVAVALAWQIDHRRIVDNYTEKLSQIESKARDNAALVSSYKRAAEFALDELKISKEREQIRASQPTSPFRLP